MGANNFVAMPSIPAGLAQPAESAPVDLYAVVPPNGFAVAGISVILGGSFEGSIAILGSLDGVNYRPVTQGFTAGKLTNPSNPSQTEFPPQLITDLIRYIKWKVLPNTRIFTTISITLGGSLNCDCPSGGGGDSNRLIETFTPYEDFPAFSPVVVRALDGKIGLGGGLSQDIQAYFVGVAIDASVGGAPVRVCLAGVCTVNMGPGLYDEPAPAPGMALWALGGGYASLGNSQETAFLAEIPRPYARYLGTIIDVSNYGTNNTVEAVIIPNNPADAYVGLTLRVPPSSAAKIVRMFGATTVFASAQNPSGIVGVVGVVADFQTQGSALAQYAEVAVAGAAQVQWDGQGALTPGAPVYVSADPLLPGAATLTQPANSFQIGVLIDGYSAVPQGTILVALQIGWNGAGGSGSDELVKVSFADTTPSYLGIKLQAGPRVALSVLNPGGNEALEVTAADTRVAVTGADTSPAFLGFKVSAGANISLSVLNPGANELLEITGTPDEKVKVTNADTTPGFLGSKLQAGTGITLNTLNPGANEKIEIVASGSSADEKVKATVADTTADYLQAKLAAGSNITLTLLNPGGNEQIRIAASGGGGGGFEYNLDFAAQPNSGAYADGPVVIDGKTWTVYNVANSQQFEIVNGTGLVISPTGGDVYNNLRTAPLISVPFVNIDPSLSFAKYSDIRFECFFVSADDEAYEGVRCYFENGNNAAIGGYNSWGLARQTEPAGRRLYLGLTDSGLSTFDGTNIGASVNDDVFMLRWRGVDNVELWTAQSVGGNFPDLSAYRFQGRINQPGISSGIKKIYNTNDPAQLLFTLIGISVAAPNNYYPAFSKLRVTAV